MGASQQPLMHQGDARCRGAYHWSRGSVFLIPERGRRRSAGSIQDPESPSASWGSPCPCIPLKHGAQDRSGSPQGHPSMSQSSYTPGSVVAWCCCGKLPSIGELPWAASLSWGAQTPDLPSKSPGLTGMWHFFGQRGSCMAQE